MTFTTLLAIWGAGVSTLLGGVKLMEFWRDRPRLQILIQAHINEDAARAAGRWSRRNQERLVTLV